MPRPTRYIKYCSHDGCAYMASSTSREGAVHCMHSHVYAYHRPSMTVSYRGKSVAVERDRRTDELKCPCGQYVSRNARRLHAHATTAHGDNATSNTSITMASTHEDVAESNSRSSSPASSISSASDIPPAGAITSPISDDSPSARPSLPKNKSNARSNLPATTSSATPSAFVLPKSAAEHMRGRPPASHTRKHLVSSSKHSTFSVNSKHPSHAKTSHENVVSNSSRLHLSKGSHALNGRSVVVDPSPSLEPSDSHPSSSNDNIPSASNHLDRSRALGRMADDRSSDPSSPEPPVNNPSRPKNKSFSRAVDPRSVIDLDSSPGPLVPPRSEKPLTSKATKSGSSSTLSNLRAFQESSKKLKTAPTTKSKAPAGPAATAWREVDIALPSQSERRHSAISQPRAITKTSSTARPKTTLKSQTCTCLLPPARRRHPRPNTPNPHHPAFLPQLARRRLLKTLHPATPP
ncbi:hypothetical protein B0H21DRAFT_141235 [Amylocystis lapponica]|nr:hypothetical protein B0H21DRAFT_141235 [Amylocystis lapponica]